VVQVVVELRSNSAINKLTILVAAVGVVESFQEPVEQEVYPKVLGQAAVAVIT
jgi:hypothetical protein